jgi:hypothetical protein
VASVGHEGTSPGLFRVRKIGKCIILIGVSKDVRDHRVRTAAPRRFYVSYMQAVDGQMGADYEIRTPVDTAVMEQEIRAAVHARLAAHADRSHPTAHRPDWKLHVYGAADSRSLHLFFGILALVLGCVGLYGIMAYAIVRRTQEIGIRIALGASRQAVIWMVVRDAIILIAIGLTAGVPIALGLSRYLQSLLFGLKPMDAFSLIVVMPLMTSMALIAVLLPARRAVRIDLSQ